MSKMVEGLVARGLLDRRADPDDRRRLRLAVTPVGQRTLRTAREAAQSRLARLISSLLPEELAAVDRAMRLLHPVFPAGGQE